MSMLRGFERHLEGSDRVGLILILVFAVGGALICLVGTYFFCCQSAPKGIFEEQPTKEAKIRNHYGEALDLTMAAFEHPEAAAELPAEQDEPQTHFGEAPDLTMAAFEHPEAAAVPPVEYQESHYSREAPDLTMAAFEHPEVASAPPVEILPDLTSQELDGTRPPPLPGQ